MRHARPNIHAALFTLTAVWAGASAGCVHNHYYTDPLACGPTVSGPAVPYGSVCEVPSRVQGGTEIAADSPPPTLNVTPPAIVSRPRSGPRLGWRPPDAEPGLADTRIDGALDDDTLSR